MRQYLGYLCVRLREQEGKSCKTETCQVCNSTHVGVAGARWQGGDSLQRRVGGHFMGYGFHKACVRKTETNDDCNYIWAKRRPEISSSEMREREEGAGSGPGGEDQIMLSSIWQTSNDMSSRQLVRKIWISVERYTFQIHVNASQDE